MFIYCLNIVKTIFYHVLSFFWGYDYFDLDLIEKKFININLSLEQTAELEKFIIQLEWIDWLFDLSAFRYRGVLERLKEKLRVELQYQKINHIFNIRFLLHALCILLQDNEQYIFPSNESFLINGIYKQTRFIHVLSYLNEKKMCETINKINFKIKYILPILTYTYLLDIFQKDGIDIDELFLKRFNYLLQVIHETNLLLHSLQKKNWFKIYYSSCIYKEISVWFNTQKNIFLISRKINLDSQWIDPWLYVYSLKYRSQIDLYLTNIGYKNDGYDYLCSKWSKHWLTNEYNDTLDWFDIILFDDRFSFYIYEKWPLVKIFVNLFFKIECFSELWDQFEFEYVHTNQSEYNNMSLLSWKRSAYKILFFLKKETNYPINFFDCNVEKMPEKYFNSMQFFKEKCWYFKLDTFSMIESCTGNIKASQLLNHSICPDYINEGIVSKDLFMFYLRQQTNDSFTICLKQLHKFTPAQFKELQENFPENILFNFSKFVYLNIHSCESSPSYYVWLSHYSQYRLIIVKLLSERIKNLSKNLHVAFLSLPLVTHYIVEHQPIILKAWETQQQNDYLIHYDFFVELDRIKIISYQPLKNFIASSISKTLTIKATQDLTSITQLNTLNEWAQTYSSVDHDDVVNQVAVVIYKIFRELQIKNILGFELNKYGISFKLKKFINSVDIVYIDFLYLNRNLIDQWLLTAHTLLLDTIWSSSSNLEINPILIWLHKKNIRIFNEYEYQLLNKMINVKKNRSIVRYLKSIKHILISENKLEKQCWDSLEFVKYNLIEEKIYEHRPIQKKHHGSM